MIQSGICIDPSVPEVRTECGTCEGVAEKTIDVRDTSDLYIFLHTA